MFARNTFELEGTPLQTCFLFMLQGSMKTAKMYEDIDLQKKALKVG
jgi:hypothetical protein